jgi:mevalonate kinase
VRGILADGDQAQLGALLTENHALLRQIGVSNPALNRLVQAALEAGAAGAKLSGAGWGGVMIALVGPETRRTVADALTRAGAVRVLEAEVGAPQHM